ncbi:MAG: hypothetical protein N7Q72_05030, partial [Spiroplasma sp. Tabriz.8]|nr:hypothetical protein [Spiroplasma sp. Tabriz.8]
KLINYWLTWNGKKKKRTFSVKNNEIFRSIFYSHVRRFYLLIIIIIIIIINSFKFCLKIK